MVERTFSEDQYPSALLHGDVLVKAFRAVQRRLKIAFPEEGFKHHVVPPSPTKSVWDRILTGKLSVGLAFSRWTAEAKSGTSFRGTLSFPVFLIVKHSNPEAVYFGTSDKWGVGVLGMTEMAVAMLNNVPVDDVGTMRVRAVSFPDGAEWLDANTAIGGVEVYFEDVGLSDDLLVGQLPDFLTLAETWTVDGNTQPQTTLNVREDA